MTANIEAPLAAKYNGNATGFSGVITTNWIGPMLRRGEICRPSGNNHIRGTALIHIPQGCYRPGHRCAVFQGQPTRFNSPQLVKDVYA